MKAIYFKRIIAYSVSLLVIISYLTFLTSNTVMLALESQSISEQQRQNRYVNYLLLNKDFNPIYDTQIDLNASNLTKKSENIQIKDIDNVNNATILCENSFLEWNISVAKKGLYNLFLEYYPLEGKMRSIEFSLSIDGKIPFNEAEKLSVSRIWKDDGQIKKDNNNNEIRPSQKELPFWRTDVCFDNEGYTSSAFLFALSEGNHTVRLTLTKEQMAVSKLFFATENQPITYGELKKTYVEKGYKSIDGNTMIKINAENASLKSHPMLYAISDFSSPSTEPSNISKVRLNAFGGQNWHYTGEWVNWDFNVDKEGLYAITLKYRQNYVIGLNTVRRIKIDGVVPCKELEQVNFAFNQSWINLTLNNNGEPMLFYLDKGKHTITMDVQLGDVAKTLQIIEDSVYRLNEIYRRIIAITGVNPDMYRDYDLDNEIPGLNEKLNSISQILKDEAKRIEEYSRQKGGEASLFYELAYQLDSFIEKPRTIPSRLDELKGNTSALAALILRLKEQPLEFDYFIVSGENSKLPKAEAGIIETLVFKIGAFLASFFEDYNAVGNVYDKGDKKTLNVWVSANNLGGLNSGRDQMQALKLMIDDTFVPKTGIPVNLNLVDSAATLTQAVLGKKGPDVALIVPEGMPVELAMRGALQDVSSMKGFEEIKSRYMKDSFIPYTFNNKIYALPETQGFNMMFYRKDIFAELGIKPPNTWTEFYDIVPKIQKNNMQIGINESQALFETLILQKGSTFYNDQKTETRFTEKAAIEAFKEWTGFYTKYSFPLYFDAYNRFRTGEVPLTIMPYTFYNFLVVAAPEINNLWDMVPIPASVNEEGSISRTQAMWGTGVIMLNDAKNKDEAFTFMKWWTDEEQQAKFGLQVENILGPSARYNTANVEAFKRLPWSTTEQKLLLSQWSFASDIPIIPGSYYITRNITNAFRKCVYNYENPREILVRYNNDMNNEILRKRKEFGLDGGVSK